MPHFWQQPCTFPPSLPPFPKESSGYKAKTQGPLGHRHPRSQQVLGSPNAAGPECYYPGLPFFTSTLNQKIAGEQGHGQGEEADREQEGATGNTARGNVEKETERENFDHTFVSGGARQVSARERTKSSDRNRFLVGREISYRDSARNTRHGWRGSCCKSKHNAWQCMMRPAPKRSWARLPMTPWGNSLAWLAASARSCNATRESSSRGTGYWRGEGPVSHGGGPRELAALDA